MMILNFEPLTRQIDDMSPFMRVGTVTKVTTGSIAVKGLSVHARAGDLVEIQAQDGSSADGEVIALAPDHAIVMPLTDIFSAAIGDEVALVGKEKLNPSTKWLGHIVDAFGRPMDGKHLVKGDQSIELKRSPPDAALRNKLGSRFDTGFAVFDTFLPIVQGQRVGVFAGSGVGKTTLLASLAREIQADCVVIGLIGERGRELREFIDVALGEEGMKKSVIVAATSDQSAIMKRRAAWTATGIAEVFRDIGLNVLLIIDSLTRFAEAHREIALTAGEPPSLRAFPPSTVHSLAALTERAGPGQGQAGHITAIYSVLVSGGDMDEPVADMTRGLLDGHVILDREIAERGRFPAINVGQSVSRSLPEAATLEENELLRRAREILNTYDNAEMLISAGLYSAGADPRIDEAIQKWPLLDKLAATFGVPSAKVSFDMLRGILEDTTTEPSLQDHSGPNVD